MKNQYAGFIMKINLKAFNFKNFSVDRETVKRGAIGAVVVLCVLAILGLAYKHRQLIKDSLMSLYYKLPFFKKEEPNTPKPTTPVIPETLDAPLVEQKVEPKVEPKAVEEKKEEVIEAAVPELPALNVQANAMVIDDYLNQSPVILKPLPAKFTEKLEREKEVEIKTKATGKYFGYF